MSKVPLEMVERIKRRRTEVDFGTDAPNDKTLIKLHRQGHLRSKIISKDLDFELWINFERKNEIGLFLGQNDSEKKHHEILGVNFLPLQTKKIQV